MTATTPTRTPSAPTPMTNSLTAGILPRGAVWGMLAGSWAILAIVFTLIQLAGRTKDFNLVGTLFFGTILFDILIYTTSRLVEGNRRAKDRLLTALVTTAFIIALLPLVSLVFTVLTKGVARFDISFFTESMRNIVGPGGGALHAIIGTLEITAFAALISVPIGLMTAIYLVEYGRGHLARSITFLVDVMTGIPSIVAGLFAYSLLALVYGPAIRSGAGGSIALSILMIPIVVRSSEEILKLVPNELREAAYALGVPKWLTVVKVVLPTSAAGITTGIMLAVARVIGETAPLLLVAGFTQSVNYNLFSQQMQTLPVFVYQSYVAQGLHAQDDVNRAWAGALTLILIVMILNLIARLVARFFSPKLGR
jgi:phosphate transport system permease protein